MLNSKLATFNGAIFAFIALYVFLTTTFFANEVAAAGCCYLNSVCQYSHTCTANTCRCFAPSDTHSGDDPDDGQGGGDGGVLYASHKRRIAGVGMSGLRKVAVVKKAEGGTRYGPVIVGRDGGAGGGVGFDAEA